jgi:uridine kinase
VTLGSARSVVVAELAERLTATEWTEVLRVGVDGTDGAGKTTLADELSVEIGSSHEVVRVSIDGFHNPAAIRHRRETTEPALSYYEDSFDYGRFVDLVVQPVLGPPPRAIRPAVFDHLADCPVEAQPVDVPDGSVLVVDGIFLGRPELRPFWDVWVYVMVSDPVACERAIARDAPTVGSPDVAARRYAERYQPGQRTYREKVDPISAADIVLDNNDLEAPRLARISLR